MNFKCPEKYLPCSQKPQGQSATTGNQVPLLVTAWRVLLQTNGSPVSDNVFAGDLQPVT